MAARRLTCAPKEGPVSSSNTLRRSSSWPDISMLCADPTNNGGFLVKDGGTSSNDQLLRTAFLVKDGGTNSNDQLLRTALKGKELKNLSLKELKSELDMRGLTKAGNKAALSERLKSAILNKDSRPSSTNKSVANDIEAVRTNDDQPVARNCPCSHHLSPLMEDLRSEIRDIKQKMSCSHDRPTEVGLESSIKRFKEENDYLRTQMAAMSERYDRIKEERDSLKLVVSIISKDLYQQSRVNISDTTPSSANLHSSRSLIQDEIKDQESQESQENTNDCKTVKTGVNKKQRMSSTGTKSKYTSTNNKPNRTDSGASAQNDERITVVVGDSIIKNVHGIKVAKAVGHRVVVKPFPGANIRDMKSHITVNTRR